MEATPFGRRTVRGVTGDPNPLDIVIVADERLTDEERLEMLRGYFEERRLLGQQLVTHSLVGSVQWLHGQWLMDEMTVLPELRGGKGVVREEVAALKPGAPLWCCEPALFCACRPIGLGPVVTHVLLDPVGVGDLFPAGAAGGDALSNHGVGVGLVVEGPGVLGAVWAALTSGDGPLFRLVL